MGEVDYALGGEQSWGAHVLMIVKFTPVAGIENQGDLQKPLFMSRDLKCMSFTLLKKESWQTSKIKSVLLREQTSKKGKSTDSK